MRPPCLDSFHSVARAYAVDFGVIAFKTRLACDGCAHHFQTQCWRCERGIFKRRTRGGDEDDTIQRELFHRLAGENQVPVVDGIKGASVERGAHGS